MNTAKEIYEKLKSIGVRLFALRLNRDMQIFVHTNKTTAEWREDIRKFRNSSLCQPAGDFEGWADDTVFNALYKYLHDLGYEEIDDVVADVYEGRIAVVSAKLMDNPDHEEQEDGFGHFGWDKGEGK